MSSNESARVRLAAQDLLRDLAAISGRENHRLLRLADAAVNRVDGIIAQIYEDKVGGEISAERFAKMLAQYEREQADLTARLDELWPLIAKAEDQTLNTDRFLRIVKSYTEIGALTAEVVSEFIEKVVVGETVMVQPRKFSHWADEKRQNIRIVYNYIGDVPQEGELLTANANGKTAYRE